MGVMPQRLSVCANLALSGGLTSAVLAGVQTKAGLHEEVMCVSLQHARGARHAGVYNAEISPGLVDSGHCICTGLRFVVIASVI